jgi:LysM repeat protein
MFGVVILGAIAFGVYLSINSKPGSELDSGTAEGWTQPPDVQVPELAGSEPSFGSPGSTPPAMGPSPAGLTPPFSGDPSSMAAVQGDVGPPYASLGGSVDSAGYDAVPPPNGAQPTDASGAALASDQVSGAFTDFLEAMHQDLQQGKLAEVHETLSRWYDNPQLNPEESRRLTALLDQVAGTVVFSPGHWLGRPYEVKADDTLPRIARYYGVPWQVLAKINGIQDPDNLEPGRRLKVIRGPFDAVIRLDRLELTLMLGNLYATRFRIGLGSNAQTLEGTYYVEEKLRPAEPSDPVGKYWIQLGNEIGFHGTNDPQGVGMVGGPGSIRLGERDIADVHDILSIGSRVDVLR